MSFAFTRNFTGIGDGSGRTAFDTGMAATVECVQAVAVHISIGSFRRSQSERGNNAAETSQGTFLGDKILMQAKGAEPCCKGGVPLRPEGFPSLGVVTGIDIRGYGIATMAHREANQRSAHNIQKLGAVPFSGRELYG